MSNRIGSSPVSRRRFLYTAAGGCVLIASGLAGIQGCSKPATESSLALPPLPYKPDALEPFISSRTMDFHYGKHHKAYVDKAVELIRKAGMSGLSLDQVILQTAGSPDKAPLFNNAAQAWNHDFYWKCMVPGGSRPGDDMMKHIQASFGSYDHFKKEFVNAALTQFGSGWAWLVADGGRLKVVRTSNADNPMVSGQKPLLTIDVWEHAYYLDYQNRRADYVNAVVDNLLNWDFAASNMAKA